MPTRIYLIRHAETEETEEDRFAGMRDLRLTEMGRQHAEALAIRLQAFKLEAIYTSPLQRARETAEIVAAPHGLPVVAIDALREISHGHWEGLKRQEVEKRFPEEYAAYEHDPLDFAPPGGETARAVVERAMPALLRIVQAHPEQQVAVISHKATNRLLLAYLLGIKLELYRDKLAQRATCLNVIDFTSPTRAKLMLFDDISHYAICALPDEQYVV